MLLTEKYRPNRLSKFLGNTSEIKKVKQWILNWKRGIKGKPLLITGPVGVGKTSLAHAVADEFGFELYEINESQEYSHDTIEKLFNHSLVSGTLFGKPRLLLVDDADKMALMGRGLASKLSSLLKDPPFPIILTAIDPWDPSLSSVRGFCEVITLKRPSNSTLERYLLLIAEKEKIPVTKEMIKKIVESAEGDVRAALNSLQGMSTAPRNINIKIMDALRRMFNAKTFVDARRITTMVDMDPDMLTLWIEENMPRELQDPEELAEGFYYLSRADVFRGRIKRRNVWGFLRYSLSLMTAGVALAKKEHRFRFVPYTFPTYLKYMSRTKEHRRTLNSIITKFKNHGRIHASGKEIREMLPLIKLLIEKYDGEALSFYDLDPKEAAFILGTTESKAKKYFKKS